MALNKCANCRYCQKRWDKDQFGKFTTSYYGCNYAPHWGKNIETIYKCPKDFTQKDRNAIAKKLNGF